MIVGLSIIKNNFYIKNTKTENLS